MISLRRNVVIQGEQKIKFKNLPDFGSGSLFGSASTRSGKPLRKEKIEGQLT